MKIKPIIVASLCWPAVSYAEPPTLGGHVRINYDYRDWISDEDRSRMQFESLKLTVKGETENIEYKADYRWYENVDMTTVKYADFTLNLDEQNKVTAGVTQVPFGMQGVASNSFWFSINYYLGFEDDYDAGVVYNRTGTDWSIQAGYFFSDEYDNPSNFSRYSFDVAANDEYRNKENGQWNLRVNKTLNWENGSNTEFGLSLQQADILNLDTMENGDHFAYSFHVRHKLDKLKFEYEYVNYDYDLETPLGQSDEVIAMSSFNFDFLMAAKAESHIFNVVYQVPYENKLMKGLTCYSEYGVVNASGQQNDDSTQWVNGCYFQTDDLWIYVDSIRGKNMWFSGGPGVGFDNQTEQDWTNRLNINIGYYF